MESASQDPNAEQVKSASVNLAVAFDNLQSKLPAMWREIGKSYPVGHALKERTVVVVPSMTLDMAIPTIKQQVYEERFLFLLFLLAQTNLRLIYITSIPISADIIDYYLELLPGVIMSNARRRLYLVSPNDGSETPLSQKLLKRPSLLQKIRDMIPDPDNAHIVPFNTTSLERELAVRLGIPMYAADPSCWALGTKSGARLLFSQEGISHALGEEGLFSEDAAVEAIMAMRAQKPTVDKIIAKLNEGVGGMGNAMVALEGIPGPGHGGERKAVRDRLRGMQFEIEDIDYESYMSAWQEHGGIVEEFLTGIEVHSPSVQLRNSPLGEVQVLSTHDQLLGGPTGQTFLGAVFPANPAYARLITRDAQKIGERLVQEGVIGRYAVDFLVIRRPDGDWQSFAIEINLRKGGTTTPFLTLQYLTRGEYDPESGLFRTLQGQEKYYVASDHIESEAYRRYTPADLFDLLSISRLQFDHASQTGIVLHMISGVGTYGSLGATVIGDTPEQAQSLYESFQELLDKS
ncbi:MAG: peptide ligase PGM1-related protein [Candidatus Promineifilaceae bacterium]|nr:peptide ligase PGM1-related protein [Candidatus Promineifilaceae bacterium]